MTVENEEDYRNNHFCHFCEKNIESDKVRNHCHLTGKYRSPAHIICNINVTRKQIIFIPFIFPSFSNSGCYIFFKNLVEKKNGKL